MNALGGTLQKRPAPPPSPTTTACKTWVGHAGLQPRAPPASVALGRGCLHKLRLSQAAPLPRKKPTRHLTPYPLACTRPLHAPAPNWCPPRAFLASLTCNLLPREQSLPTGLSAHLGPLTTTARGRPPPKKPVHLFGAAAATSRLLPPRELQGHVRTCLRLCNAEAAVLAFTTLSAKRHDRTRMDESICPCTGALVPMIVPTGWDALSMIRSS